jgi:cytochrome c-type biogenesis protein CcsB
MRLKALFLCAPFALAAVFNGRGDDKPSIDTSVLATLAVQDHGRKKPFTTFAQEVLLTMAGRSDLPQAPEADAALPPLSAETIVLDLWLKPEGWDTKPLILVSFADLKRKLGLPLDSGQKLFTYDELIHNAAFNDLLQEATKVRQIDDKKLTAVEKEGEDLGVRLQLFQDCVNGVRETIVPHPSAPDGRWVPIQNLGTVDSAPWPPVEVSGSYYSSDDSRAQDAGRAFTAWSAAWRDGDLEKFNATTPELVSALASLSPAIYPAAGSLKFEHAYMQLHPFRKAWIVYLFALLVLLGTAIWQRAAGYKVAWLLVLGGLGLEAYGFGCRIIISGRPPVTDLYETVIWVSFVAMAIAVILEAIYRKRLFFYAGIPASILTLIIADSQPTILDASINPLTAVLRNNMWLTIHVLTIVSSYAAFVLTAALGHIALVLSLWGRRYAAARADLNEFIYRAMQIGILLLGTGTILGGVWANYSWGRFWGWDPKETWALITFLFYLAVLHGRLAGRWGEFGLAVGSVICFLSVLMSWYGVNFILGQNGRSLHSYGLSTGGLSYATGFAAFEIVFVAFVIVWHRMHPEDAPPEPTAAPEPELVSK